MATEAVRDVRDSQNGTERGRTRTVDESEDKARVRTVETEPRRNSWMIVAAGATVPLGLACAATVATYVTKHERVAVTAWIAVAVIGTAAVISNAVASNRRIRSVASVDESDRDVARSNERLRTRE